MYRSTISSEEIMLLPLFKLASEDIFIIDNLYDFNKIKENLFSENIWGIDVETKPIFKKNIVKQRKPSLLQLSNESKTYLIRLNKVDLPQELIYFFYNPKILKIGLALKDDLSNLRKIANFNSQGFIDLQDLVKGFGIEELSLRKIAAIVLGCRISKKQRASNWESENLSIEQIKYAATDSFITREIYLKLYNNDRARI